MRNLHLFYDFSLETSPGKNDYGPDTIVSVIVLVYVPSLVDPGMKTETVGTTVYVPEPVAAAVLKNLTAVGAVTAAGMATAVVTRFVSVGLEHVPALVQFAVVPVTVEAVTGIVLLPEVRVVEVMVRFHPAAAPVRSLPENDIGYVGVPPGVPEKV